MAEDLNLNLSALSLSGATGILSLPEAILLQIISYLEGDLRTLARLSQVSRFLSNVARSDDIWRPISKALVGPWVHRPLISKQTRISDRPQEPPIPFDWTLDPNCVPVSHITQTTSTQPQASLFPSWHKFATLFLIPHFNFFGWHISSKSDDCQIILVTYNAFSGQLIFEEVKCFNQFQSVHDRPEDPTVLGLPPWVPINRIQFQSDGGLGYTISPGIDLPNRGTFEIFRPAYSFSFLHVIPALYSRYQSSETKPVEKIHTWQNFMANKGMPQIRHADKIIAPRFTVLNQRNKDLVTDPGFGQQRLVSFTLFKGPARRACFAINGPMAYDHDQPGEILKGLWVGVAGNVRGQIEFGKIIEERQSDSYRQMRFLKLTGGRPQYIWEVGIHYARPFPTRSLDEALTMDFDTGHMDDGLKGTGKNVAGIFWQDIKVQFINDPEASLNELNINQIRVKWCHDEVVRSYYKVEFHL